ncbi:MAG: hypothetical protein OEU36_11455 [Gammaproteobacteria bacterium]|nr:hypothetical protein [Gammaproteobacteria bacterium]
MNRLGIGLASLGAVALLALQVGGIHLHAESSRHSEATEHQHGIHVAHELSAEHHSNEHTNHVDLDVADTPLKFSTYDFVAVSNQTGGKLTTASIRTFWSLPRSNAPPHSTFRMRPPLRAPPKLV